MFWYIVLKYIKWVLAAIFVLAIIASFVDSYFYHFKAIPEARESQARLEKIYQKNLELDEKIKASIHSEKELQEKVEKLQQGNADINKAMTAIREDFLLIDKKRYKRLKEMGVNIYLKDTITVEDAENYIYNRYYINRE